MQATFYLYKTKQKGAKQPSLDVIYFKLFMTHFSIICMPLTLTWAIQKNCLIIEECNMLLEVICQLALCFFIIKNLRDFLLVVKS